MPHRPIETFDAIIVGHHGTGGCCRAVKVRFHGRIYGDGQVTISWHDPANPMRGGSKTYTEPEMAQALHELWTAFEVGDQVSAPAD